MDAVSRPVPDKVIRSFLLKQIDIRESDDLQRRNFVSVCGDESSVLDADVVTGNIDGGSGTRQHFHSLFGHQVSGPVQRKAAVARIPDTGRSLDRKEAFSIDCDVEWILRGGNGPSCRVDRGSHIE